MRNNVVVWYKTREELGPNEEPEIHINLCDPGTNDGGTFLDVGIMIFEMQKVEKVCFYLPFHTKEFALLNKSLSNARLLAAIFNDEIEVEVLDPQTNTIIVKRGAGADRPFLLIDHEDGFCDGKERRVFDTIRGDDGGELIQISVEKITQFYAREVARCKNVYFRMRFKYEGNGFVHLFKPTDAPFLSGHEQTKVFDFRLNSKREIDQRLWGRIKSDNGKMLFSNIWLFLIKDSKDAFEFSAPEVRKARILENDLWKGYMPTEMCEGILFVYYLNKSNNASDLRLVARFRHDHRTKKTILMYVAVFLLLSVISSLAANWIFQQIASGH